jgi:hypothetical protein
VRSCPQCGGDVQLDHRYCPWCAAPQRLKLVRFFSPSTAVEADHGKMLRVSYYVGAPEGRRHVRFSVWNEDGVAASAVSLDPVEARRLAEFIVDPCGSPPNRLASILTRLREDVELAFSRERAGR